MFCNIIIILFDFASQQDIFWANNKMEIFKEQAEQVPTMHCNAKNIKTKFLFVHFSFIHKVSFCTLSSDCGIKPLPYRRTLGLGGVTSWREWELR